MTQLVVDASSIGRALLPDETDLSGEEFWPVLESFELVEPAHWPIECASLLLKASRRKRIDDVQRGNIRQMLRVLHQSAVVEALAYPIAAFDLAVAQNISVYDAAYLELALRSGLALLTDDHALSGAARRAGVDLLILS
jgi:predicted nucleic acid-binding protein